MPARLQRWCQVSKLSSSRAVVIDTLEFTSIFVHFSSKRRAIPDRTRAEARTQNGKRALLEVRKINIVRSGAPWPPSPNAANVCLSSNIILPGRRPRGEFTRCEPRDAGCASINAKSNLCRFFRPHMPQTSTIVFRPHTPCADLLFLLPRLDLRGRRAQKHGKSRARPPSAHSPRAAVRQKMVG